MSAGGAPARTAGLSRAHALTGAIVLLAAGILASIYQDQVFRAQRGHELTVQGEILSASLTAALVFGDARVVQEHVSALAINPEIAAAAVYGSKGELIASYARNGADPLPRSEQSAAAMSRATMIRVPVRHNRETLGTVYIRAIEEPFSRRLTRHVPIMLLAVMAALLVAVMATTQRALREANRQLESRAIALAETNRLLEKEIEERNQAEEALRQSQKMEAVGRLAGGISHDFNNLLAIIQGNLHLLRQMDGSDPAEVHAFAAAAGEAADRAGQLVKRLLAFSRRQPLSPQPVDINQLALGMEALIVHSVGGQVRVAWDLRARWKTACDINQMENVILNLAINARDAMPGGGTLTIATDDVSRRGEPDVADGEFVELRMRDTGVGMTEEVRRKAFDPFFTTKPHGQGTGLGLSTAFAFIRQSSGYLSIETELGSGTTIVILLPRRSDLESPEAT